MTVFYFASDLSDFSEYKEGYVKEGFLKGYPYYYRDIIIKPGEILPKGALIYVKDRGADDEPWNLARYDNLEEDEIYATLVENPLTDGGWRYALIPAEIYIDVTKIPSAEEILKSMKER